MKIRGGTRERMRAAMGARQTRRATPISAAFPLCTVISKHSILEDSIHVKRIALAVLLAITLIPAASFAQVMIRVGPPPPVYERRGPPPGDGYVWQDGYHRYDGDHYVWTAGHYERPPHRGQRWVAHHWVHHHDGYVLVEGHWR